MDGVSHDFDGFLEGDQEDYNAVLFNATDLSVNFHQVELINMGDDAHRGVLDLSHVRLSTAFVPINFCSPFAANISNRICQYHNNIIYGPSV